MYNYINLRNHEFFAKNKDVIFFFVNKSNMLVLVGGFKRLLDEIISKVVFLSESLFNAQFKVCCICRE